MAIPDLFFDRLEQVIPEDRVNGVVATFSQDRPCCFRLNALKITLKELLRIFQNRKIAYKKILSSKELFSLKNIEQKEQLRDLIDEGKIYVQNASSMIPALLLNCEPGDNVLDMCAAPGSKTSQMATMMDNTGNIYAVEAIKGRTYKLRAVLKITGVTNTRVFCCDARRFKSPDIEKFDKVLVDVPCSSEGRFRESEKKTYQYWGIRKIKEMVKKQRGILMAASRHLNNGGLMVYSTCSFSPEENEGVLDWFLKKTEGQFFLEKIDKKLFPHYKNVLEWKNKTFDRQITNALRVLPDNIFEGFFVALIRKQH